MTWQVRKQGAASLGETTVADLLEEVASRQPERPALLKLEDEVSYGQLLKTSRQLAAGLAALGVRRGDRVAILGGNSSRWMALFFAIARLGAVVVAVHTRYQPRELAHVLRNSGSRILFCDQRSIAKVLAFAPDLAARPKGGRQISDLPALEQIVMMEGHNRGALAFDEVLGAATDVPPVEVLPRDLLMIKYTSGSTGSPKGVMLRHGAVIRNAFNTGERLEMLPGDRMFSPMPFFHSGGSILSILCALTQDATLVTLEHFDAGAALDAIERYKCTVHIGMDLMFMREIAHPSYSIRRVSTLRTGWFGGTGAKAREVYRAMGFRFTCPYGMTELSGNTCMTSRDDPDDLRLDWAGEPQPGIEVGIFDPDSQAAVPAGRVGRIRVRGWCVMDGYYNEPAATRAALLDDGWLETGDLGFLGPNGYLQFTGREKLMLKVGGENVAMREVEQLLYAHPKVKIAEVVGIPDSEYGEIPVAFVELRAGEIGDEEELIDFCRSGLARFKVPRHVRFMEDGEWPLTGPEKIRKPDLQKLAIAEFLH